MIGLSARLAAVLSLAAGGFGLAQAQPVPPPAVPMIPVPGLRPSCCPLPEPKAGRLRTFPVPQADGVYAAHGDPSLLPVAINVSVGEGPHPAGIDQLLFGAQTVFTMPAAARLLDHPNPVESLGVPRQPMAELWGNGLAGAGPATYRLPLTASVWEIVGRQAGRAKPVMCLYFARPR